MKINQLFESIFDSTIILEEGVNYAEMFSSVDKKISMIIDEYQQLFGPDSDPERILIEKYEGRKRQKIKDIKAINERQDFRIWMTRIAKIYLIGWMVLWIEGDIEEYRGNYLDSYAKRILNIIGDMIDEKIKLMNDVLGMQTAEAGSFNDLIWAMEHFFSLPIPEIQEFEFRKEYTYRYVYDLFSEYEYQWQQNIGTKDSRLVSEKGHKIIDFGDGYAWWDLEDTWCPEEGKAAGHCGNSPNKDDPNQKALSLRKETGVDGVYEPALFFVYHIEEKGLGERKGVGNSRPNPKYHKYIEALIMEPFIERFLEGRSYMAENDFQITDLPNWKQIWEQKPDLLPLRQYINEFGFDDYIKSKFEFDSRYSSETVIDDGNELHLIYNKSRIEETIYKDTSTIGYKLANMMLYGNKEDRKGTYELDWMQDTIYKLGQKLFPNLNPFKWYELFKNTEDFYKPQSSAVRIADQIRNICANAFQDMLIEAIKDPSKITGKAELFVKETSGRGFSIEPASHVFKNITWEGYATNNGIGITINKDALFGHVDPYVLSDDFTLVLSIKEFELIPRGSYGPFVTIGNTPYNDPGFLKTDVSYEFDEFIVETDVTDIILNQQMTAPFFRPYIEGIKKEFRELFSEYEHIAQEPFLR